MAYLDSGRCGCLDACGRCAWLSSELGRALGTRRGAPAARSGGAIVPDVRVARASRAVRGLAWVGLYSGVRSKLKEFSYSCVPLRCKSRGNPGKCNQTIAG